jgi:ribosomal protein L29
MTNFKEQSVEDLQKLVADKREALRNSRFQAAGSRSRNTREGRNLRKEVAQILTELRTRTFSHTK